MSTTSPTPFSADGARALSPRETLQRLKAKSCELPDSTMPSCSGQVYVGIFFDGTGNNMKADYETPPPEKRKHSNIVRLFQCHPNQPKEGKFRYYIPGVGTAFPEIGETGESTLGAAAAAGGEQRIVWALLDLINAPHRYVHGNDALLIDKAQAKTISDNLSGSTYPAAMRERVLNTWQDKLKAALTNQKPRVEQINVSVFGFSRGAAQARAFVNWLFAVCKQEDGAWTFAGLPIRLQFLGIFDTVASVGLANLFDTGTLAGHQSWADNSMEIHPAVEQCVHYVAGHEVRATFPLDSVRVKSRYPANALEVMYPGAHSDLGGGYPVGAVGIGRSPEALFSIIPGANMYKAARLAGVPLLPWNDLKKDIQDSLTPGEDTVSSFNAYVRDAKIGSGTVEEMGHKHMALYFSHRFKHRASFFERAPYTAASAREQGYLRITQQALIERLSSLAPGTPAKVATPRAVGITQTAEIGRLTSSASRTEAMSPTFDPPRMAKLHEDWNKAAGLTLSLKEKHTVAVAKRINVSAVTPAVEQFFDHHIHDSMAGFIEKLDEYKRNGFGFVKFRAVFKGND